MRRIFIYIMLAAAAAATTGCLEDMRKDEVQNVYSQIEVRLTLPEGVEWPLGDVEIVASNASSTRSVVYTARTDAQGVARFTVERGIYNISTQIEVVIDDDETLLMGSNDKLDVTSDIETEIDLILAYHVGKLIIKEAYFSGCKNNNDGNYGSDVYVIIYNNSDEVYYLDGMGLATAQDMMNTAASSGWQSVFDQGRVPLYQFTFCFPTNETGDRFPLQPGEEAVVCTYGIDHRDVAANSIDLGKEGYFAMYAPMFRTQTPPNSERGVITMDLINGFGTGINFYSVHITIPAFVLYKIEEMTPFEYKELPGSIMAKPGTTSPECLVIDKRWILDGIEFGNASTQFSRLPKEVNTGIQKTEIGRYSGMSWHRKVKDVIDGRTVYVDTNNTAEDFEMIDRPTLRED